jgi:DNA invertase Pin-like site-specific DNA recombinase
VNETDQLAAYIRVSTFGQNEAGQREEILRWLKGNGIDPARVQWFIDKGKSGDNLQRPAFEKLQAAIFNGTVRTVILFKLDRLSRSLRDGLNTLCGWCEKGIRVVSVTQQLDWNGTMGRMLATIFFGLAEMEQETRRERQAVGISVAKKEGKYKGRKRGTVKASPARALALRARGLTIAEVAGSLGVSEMTVSRYLKTAR